MNAVITMTTTKQIAITEIEMLRQLGINPNEYRIKSASLAYGTVGDFHTGVQQQQVLLTLVEVPDSDRKRCER